MVLLATLDLQSRFIPIERHFAACEDAEADLGVIKQLKKNSRKCPKLDKKQSKCETSCNALHRSRIEGHSPVSKISTRPSHSNMNTQIVVLRMNFARFVTQFRWSDWLFSWLVIPWGFLIDQAIRGHGTAYLIGFFRSIMIIRASDRKRRCVHDVIDALIWHLIVVILIW